MKPEHLGFWFSRSLHEILPIQCTPVLPYLPFTPNSSPFKTSMEILNPAMSFSNFQRGSTFWWFFFRGADLNNGGSPFHVPNGSGGKPQSSPFTDLNGRDLPLGRPSKVCQSWMLDIGGFKKKTPPAEVRDMSGVRCWQHVDFWGCQVMPAFKKPRKMGENVKTGWMV